jgi:hypothetical protein
LGLLAVSIAYYCSFFVPLESDIYQDVRGGRRSRLLIPHGFRFGWDGPNTRMLEVWLGPLKPEWRHLTTEFMLLGDWRDGDERVNKHNLIFFDVLPVILGRLPHDDARRQVLQCLTDPTNLLRIHQCLLLVCVHELGFPEGLDATTWWEKHSWLFIREGDPKQASRIVWGWIDRIPVERWTNRMRRWIRAAEHQQGGSWGGDPAFGPAYDDLNESLDRVKASVDPKLGVNRIAWWTTPAHSIP